MSEIYQSMRERPELAGKAIQADVGAMVDNLKDSIEVMEHLQAAMVYKGQQSMSPDQVNSYQGLDNWMTSAVANLGSLYTDCCRAKALADIVARPLADGEASGPLPQAGDGILQQPPGTHDG